MSLLTLPAPVRTVARAAAPEHRSRTRPRMLAVVVDRQSADEGLPAALDRARETDGELHVAVLLPRVPLTIDVAGLAGTAGLGDAADLVERVRRATAASDVLTTTSLHPLGGLHGGRRSRVIERAVRRIARRLEAVPLAGTAQ